MDTRFKLEDQYKDDVTFNRKMKKGSASFMKALEGEVQLSHHHKKVSPFKHNLLSKELKIEMISNVFAIRSTNCLENVSFNPDNLRCLFIPNLNIKEITMVQYNARLYNIKNQTNLIDI